MKVLTKQFNVVKALLLLLSLTGFMSARAASIRGNVTDQDSKETLIGAVISIKGEGIKRSIPADLEGNYTFKQLQPGNYVITCSYTGYQTITENVTLTEADIRRNFSLSSAGSDLKEVVVKTHLKKGSDAAARASEKNANQLLNVISAKSMKLLPDVTVANVLQRIDFLSEHNYLQNSIKEKNKH